MANVWTTLWALIDENLREGNAWARRKLRKLRMLRALLTGGILVIWTCAVGAVLVPEYARPLLALAIVAASLSLFYLHTMLSWPFEAKSVVRLIEDGYPKNIRELGIRVAARKMRDQSIETEELLVETAWNEGKKAYHRYKERAKELARRLDDDIERRRSQEPTE